MGTYGLLIVRFRGRYFVYRNSYDSGPEVLGRKLVAQIPANLRLYEGPLIIFHFD